MQDCLVLQTVWIRRQRETHASFPGKSKSKSKGKIFFCIRFRLNLLLLLKLLLQLMSEGNEVFLNCPKGTCFYPLKILI